ncbi:hypothetical protein BvCmsHHNP033_01701 [Escherichia coli]|nr:hypothetical protein BvCmsHHNP033_01701 [Escherichia coli]
MASITVHQFYLLQAGLYIFLYLCSILIHRIDVVPSAPKIPVPVFEFQIPKLLVKHQTTFPFQISHKAGYVHFGRDLYKHMDIICAAFSFQNQYAFPLILLSKNATYCSTLLSIEHLSSVFWHKAESFSDPSLAGSFMCIKIGIP